MLLHRKRHAVRDESNRAVGHEHRARRARRRVRGAHAGCLGRRAQGLWSATAGRTSSSLQWMEVVLGTHRVKPRRAQSALRASSRSRLNSLSPNLFSAAVGKLTLLQRQEPIARAARFPYGSIRRHWMLQTRPRVATPPTPRVTSVRAPCLSRGATAVRNPVPGASAPGLIGCPGGSPTPRRAARARRRPRAGTRTRRSCRRQSRTPPCRAPSRPR